MPEDQWRARRAGVETSIRTALVWDRVLATATAQSARLGRPLRVIDLGGGTGGVAVPLAGYGHDVTVVDPSLDALAALDRRINDAGVSDRVRAVQGDALTLPQVYPLGNVDLVCCHGVLEVVDDPASTVLALSVALAPDGVVSLVVAQRLAAVLARALAGRFAQAQHALDSPDGRWGDNDPTPRRFDIDDVRDMLTAAGLTIVEAHGVRIFSDLVPSAYLDTESDREALLDLERRIGTHPDHALLARLGAAAHVLARKVVSA